MGKQVWREVTDRVRPELIALAFRREDPAEYTIEVNPDTIGRILLVRVDDWGRFPDVDVDPVAGVTNRQIQRMKDEIMGHILRPGGWRPSEDSNIVRPIGKLKSPRKLFGYWRFREGRDHTKVLRDMIGAIEEYGLPFLEAHGTLETVVEELVGEHSNIQRYIYDAPIAYCLLGEMEKAMEIVNTQMEELNEYHQKYPTHRDDTDFRHFAAEFARRVEQKA